MEHEFKYWIYAKSYKSYPADYVLSDIKWSDEHLAEYGMVLIGEYVVSHKLPPIKTVIPSLVDSLKKKKEMMQAAASSAISEVDNQINMMLALEHSS